MRPDRDFDLYYSLSADAVAVNLLSYKPYDEDGFFLLLVTPPVESAGRWSPRTSCWCWTRPAAWTGRR